MISRLPKSSNQDHLPAGATHARPGLLLCLFFAVVCLLCPVRTTLAAQPEGVHTFRVICGGNWQAAPIKYDLNKTTVAVETERSLSRAYACPPKDTLVLYNEIPPPPDAPAGTPPRKQVLATLPLPPDQSKTLVVMVPDASGKISFKAVPDDFKKHPGGTLRILNFSDYPVAIAINDRQYTAPLEAPDVIVPFGSGGTLIQSAIRKDGKWMPVYRRERIARPALHTYGFVFDFISEIGAKDDHVPPTTFILFAELARSPAP